MWAWAVPAARLAAARRAGGGPAGGQGRRTGCAARWIRRMPLVCREMRQLHQEALEIGGGDGRQFFRAEYRHDLRHQVVELIATARPPRPPRRRPPEPP